MAKPDLATTQQEDVAHLPQFEGGEQVESESKSHQNREAVEQATESSGAEDSVAERSKDAQVELASDAEVDQLAQQVPGQVCVKGASLERTCLIILTTLAILYTLYFAKAILLPLTIALMLNFVLKPIIRFANRLRIPNFISASILLAAVSATFVVGGYAVYEPAISWLERAPQSVRDLSRDLRFQSSPLDKIEDVKKEVENLTKVEGQERATPVRIEQPPVASQMLNTTGSLATSVMIALTMLFFLLAAGDHFLDKTVEIVPTYEAKWDVVMVFQEIQKKISSYLATITAINAGLGIVIGLGMWAIGMPNPLLWGVVAALLNYIPFAGLVIGTAIVFVVATTEFLTLTHALLAPAIYLAANGVEANLITPAILGKSISLNPVIILLAIFLGGWIWGIGGIFLAVPILLVAKIICDSYESLKPFGIYLAR